MSRGALALDPTRLLPATRDDDSPAPVAPMRARDDRAELLRRVLSGDPRLLDELRPGYVALKERRNGR